ncbi:MAG: hypothetical protein KJ737_05295 [Proteobacteria bacterium]|nr:hypothetical protein [Pseudomonadota bacterium]
MSINGYTDFSLESPGCHPGTLLYSARFKLDGDVTGLFPYLNAVLDKASYYEKPLNIQFQLEGIRCALYPDYAAAAPFENQDQAKKFISCLIDFLNDLNSKKDSITPDHRYYRPIPVINIYKLLPGTNCKACGFAACMAFAASLSKGESRPDQCPGLIDPESSQVLALILSV